MMRLLIGIESIEEALARLTEWCDGCNQGVEEQCEDIEEQENQNVETD